MRSTFFAVLAAIGLSCPAAAQMLDPAQPQGIVNALQDLGYRAQLDASDSGRPRIQSAIEGTTYTLSFYNCRDDFTDCGSLLLSTGFDLSDGLNLAAINRWNREALQGRAYADDESDPFLDYFVDAEGGITTETFQDVIEDWGRALVRFKDHIGWE